MAKTANINVRIEPEVKQAAEDLFGSFGLSVTDAINVFLRTSLMEDGFPFSIRQPRFSAETEAAMQEAKDIAAGRIQAKSYSSIKELFADLDSEDDE